MLRRSKLHNSFEHTINSYAKLTRTKRVHFTLPSLSVFDILPGLGYSPELKKGVNMNFKVASKIRAGVKISALIMFATVVAVSPRTGRTSDIYHHWPHAGSMTAIADVYPSPEIYHHWPHAALVIAALDSDVGPDIFHHWPHVA